MRRKDPPYVVFGAHGGKADKAVVAVKSKRLSGWEVHICQCSSDMERGSADIPPDSLTGEYMTLFFCRKDTLQGFIRVLQEALDKWEGAIL